MAAAGESNARITSILVRARMTRGAEGEAVFKAGRAKVWGTKATLGKILGKTESGVVALTNDGLAQALARACDLAEVDVQGRGRPRSRSSVGKVANEEGGTRCESTK